MGGLIGLVLAVLFLYALNLAWSLACVGALMAWDRVKRRLRRQPS